MSDIPEIKEIDDLDNLFKIWVKCPRSVKELGEMVNDLYPAVYDHLYESVKSVKWTDTERSVCLSAGEHLGIVFSVYKDKKKGKWFIRPYQMATALLPEKKKKWGASNYWNIAHNFGLIFKGLDRKGFRFLGYRGLTWTDSVRSIEVFTDSGNNVQFSMYKEDGKWLPLLPATLLMEEDVKHALFSHNE